MARKIYTDLDLLSTAKIINVPAPTLGTDAANKEYVDSSLIRTHTSLIGDGVATTLTVAHNLGTEFVIISLREATGNKIEVYPEIRYTDANNISLIFQTAPALNSIRAVVIK